ncbi:MAG: polysaccharide deacetylase family protein, partial [Candidatus Methylomirabilis sp.]
MKLVVTIDTEEDNWGNFAASRSSLGNIERIPALQELFDHFAVTPTYLITYPVATDERAVSVLRAILQRGRCEIGAHCHPWNTPPLEEQASGPNSMLCNLPGDLQYAKMKSLHETIRRHFGVAPLSFRSGRFGYN